MKRHGARRENLRATLFALLGGVAGTLAIAWLPRLGIKPVVAASAATALASAGAAFTSGPAQAALAGAAAAGAASLVQLWFARRAAARSAAVTGSGSVLEQAVESAMRNRRRPTPPPQTSPLRAKPAMTDVVAHLEPDEQEKLAQVFAALPPERARVIRSRLARLRVETAVEFLRDLLHRHTGTAVAEAA